MLSVLPPGTDIKHGNLQESASHVRKKLQCRVVSDFPVLTASLPVGRHGSRGTGVDGVYPRCPGDATLPHHVRHAQNSLDKRDR